MGKNKKGRSDRPGLLSKRERELIEITDKKKELMREREQLLTKNNKTSSDRKRIKEISQKLNYSSKRFSKLEHDLLSRLEPSREDLQLILQSKSLQGFRTKYKKFFRKPFFDGDYANYPLTGLLDEMGKLEFKAYDGTELIPNYSTWKVFEIKTAKERKYWLSTDEVPPNTVRDTSEPTFAISGIKGTWRRFNDIKSTTEIINVREILLKALDLEKRYQGWIASDKLPSIMPRSQDKVKNILNIRSIIQDFEKELKSLTGIIAVKNPN